MRFWVENKIYSSLDVRHLLSKLEEKLNRSKSDKLPDNLPNPSNDVSTLAEKIMELEKNKHNINKL
jgi:hypothetical protein